MLKSVFINNLIKVMFTITLFISVTYLNFAYPLIKSTDEKDLTYKQFISRQKDPSSSLTMFEYTLPTELSLTDITKLFNISLDTLITINRSSIIKTYKRNSTVVIPTKSGVFMAVSPKSDLEFQINNRLWDKLTTEKPIIMRSAKAKVRGTFYFFEKQKLNTLEKNTWKITNFRLPVLKGIVSSGYGYRISPISGKKIFHKGVDIAARSGSQIFASKSGTVTTDGYTSLYGYYIVVKHDNVYSSLYGHLLEPKIKVGDVVSAGQLIGYMGNSGVSTGPHVHFEIQKNGNSQNPLLLTTPRRQ